MIYRDIPVMPQDSDIYFTAQDFLAMIGGAKVAIINPYIFNNEALEFAVTIGINRGANFQVFPDTESAETWLTKGAHSLSSTSKGRG